MLALTRRLEKDSPDDDHATIKIGDNMRLIAIRGEQVRIGVSAPHDVQVNRTEAWHDKKAKEEWKAMCCEGAAECSLLLQQSAGIEVKPAADGQGTLDHRRLWDYRQAVFS